MRIEIAGVQITFMVVDALEDLQNNEIGTGYVRAIDEISRFLMKSDEDDTELLMGWLRELTLMRHTLTCLISPSDADDPDNDTPTAQI